MNVLDCLNRLAINELSNTAFSTGARITKAKIPMVIACMNEALMLIYSKFLISEKAVFLETNEHKTKYILSMDHLIESCNTEPPIPDQDDGCVCDDCDKYLWDTEEYPFTGDVIKILSVTNDEGFTYPLNNPASYFSLYTPSPNVLQVPHPSKGEVMSVFYQAKHPELNLAKLDTQLELPESMYGLFFAYTAYLIFNSMQSEMAVATAQKFYNQYNLLVQEVINNDIVNTSYSQTNTRFRSNGWY